MECNTCRRYIEPYSVENDECPYCGESLSDADETPEAYGMSILDEEDGDLFGNDFGDKEDGY